jgi:uroporphyrinogen-III decarboxylase
MTLWAESNNSVWNHYFNYVSTNRAMFDIKDGKISPWILLNSTKGKELLNQFRDDQLAAISNIIDPQVWVKKFKKQIKDLELVKNIIKESNL